MKKTLILAFIILHFFFLCGCGKTQEELAFEAREKLTKLNYKFDKRDFLDAITRNDMVALRLFMDANFDIEFSLKYKLNLTEDNPIKFLSEIVALSGKEMTVNPLSLATISGSNEALKFLLSGKIDLKKFNEITISDLGGKNKSDENGLIGVSILALNPGALRMFLNAGVSCQQQCFLDAALASAMIMTEYDQKMEAFGVIVAELINQGQDLFKFEKDGEEEEVAIGYKIAYQIEAGKLSQQKEKLKKIISSNIRSEKEKIEFEQMLQIARIAKTVNEFRSCYACSTAILHAVEMYNMVHEKMMTSIKHDQVCSKNGWLVQGGYLKEPIVPPTSQCVYIGEEIDGSGSIKCLKHGSPEDNQEMAKALSKDEMALYEAGIKKYIKPLPKAQAKNKTVACYENMRVILGAVEMYNMDHTEMLTSIDDNDLTNPDGVLVKGKYLKDEIVKPTEECFYMATGDLSDDGLICCRKHGTIEDGPYHRNSDEILNGELLPIIVKNVSSKPELQSFPQNSGNQTLEQVKEQETKSEKTIAFNSILMPTGTVTAKSGLSIRVKPDSGEAKIGKLKFNEKVKIVDLNGPDSIIDSIEGKWFKIKSEALEGWCFGGFMEVEWYKVDKSENDAVKNFLEILNGFANRFNNDSSFQVNHVRFPVKCISLDGDYRETISEKTREDWTSNIKFDLENCLLELEFISANSFRIVERGRENGIRVEYVFSQVGQEIFLVGINDLST